MHKLHQIIGINFYITLKPKFCELGPYKGGALVSNIKA